MTTWTCSLLILNAMVFGAEPDRTSPVVRPGWDWMLPAHVKPVDYSGYVTWGPRRFDPAITVRGVMATWARLNPSPGTYDWDWLRREIDRNWSAGMRTGIHLKGVQRDAVPDWVIERYDPVVLDVPPLQENQPWRIQIVPPWQPDVDKAFHEFLHAFAGTAIAQDDRVVYGYIHGISASRGEEMFIRPVDWKMWQETTGVTAETFADWLRRRIDAMCEAFQGVEYKLAVTWGGPLGPTPALRTATADLHEYAFRKGCGIRGGGIDFMHGLLDAPAWGARVDSQGYLVVDDDHPTIKEGRFRGDENEEYGKYWEWRFGPVAGHAYRHRISVLRGLQMRQNFQMVSPATLQINPALNEYARVTQGYRREKAPDGWAYLRQFDWRGRAIRNIERWVIQRDAPGNHSVPANPVDRSPLPAEQRAGITAARDFDGRRTDIRHGQKGLLFALDRGFWPKAQPAVIKITYTDHEPARWFVQYTDREGIVRQTPPVDNTGDGELKTATFQLASLSATGRFPNDPEFLAWRDEPLQETGNQVKNGTFQSSGEHWHMPPEYTIVADPDRPAGKMVKFIFRPGNDDTVHMDQLVPVRQGTTYRLTATIRNDGRQLRPGVRVARMDWSTIVYLQAEKHGQWQTLSDTFTSDTDGTIRLQLFGQGRGYAVPGQSGSACFRDVSLEPVPRAELAKAFSMDFRLVTEGPGDLTVTMVRVMKP